MNETPPRRADSQAQSQAVVERLRCALNEATALLERLGEAVAGTAATDAKAAIAPARELDDVSRKLSAAEADRDELASMFVESEQQVGRIMNLYVATYQLHATLDPEDVEAAVAEIAADLLGAESYLLLLKGDEGREDHLALSVGIASDTATSYLASEEVRAALDDGVLRIADGDDPGPRGVVPLRVQDTVVGALVIVKLFDHKDRPLSEDRDLLELMAAHVASALFAARAYQALNRKLRTLEGLTGLLRASPTASGTQS